MCSYLYAGMQLNSHDFDKKVNLQILLLTCCTHRIRFLAVFNNKQPLQTSIAIPLCMLH